MEDNIQTQVESKENDNAVEKSRLSKEKKQQKLERERTILLSRLNENNLEDVRTKVAFILNHYPATRDSDTALTINYWKMFHSDLVGAGIVALDNLYYLPKFNTISRARAKIQNEYRLYQASAPIKGRRVELELGVRSCKTIFRFHLWPARYATRCAAERRRLLTKRTKASMATRYEEENSSPADPGGSPPALNSSPSEPSFCAGHR